MAVTVAYVLLPDPMGLFIDGSWTISPSLWIFQKNCPMNYYFLVILYKGT